MGLSASWHRPKQFTALLMAVSRKPWREGLYLLIGPQHSTVYYGPSTSLNDLTISIKSIYPAVKPLALRNYPLYVHTRHDKVGPCDNSPFTLLSQITIVSHLSKHLDNDCITRKSEKDSEFVFVVIFSLFFCLKLATQIVQKHWLTRHLLGSLDGKN